MNTQQIISEFAKLINGTNTKLLLQQAYDHMISYAKITCRPDTIKYYEKCYFSIKEWYHNNNIYYVEDIDKNNLNQYVNYLKVVRGLKNNSINKHIEVIKHITKYNYDNELSNANKISNYKKLKRDDIETSIIDINNIHAILNYMSSLDLDNIVILRNVLSIYLMKDTGVRLNEVRHIKINNIFINENRITLDFTKTGKNRDVFFSNATKDLIIKLLSFRDINGCIYLLSNYQTKEIVYRSAIYDFLAAIKKTLNITISISPHKWRHTLATTLLKANVNIKVVQEILGHTSLEITKRYLHIDNEYKASQVLSVLN